MVSFFVAFMYQCPRFFGRNAGDGVGFGADERLEWLKADLSPSGFSLVDPLLEKVPKGLFVFF